MTLPFSLPGDEALCPACREWSSSYDWDRIGDDVFECPECGYASGPLDASPPRRSAQRRKDSRP
jgi:Zn ribbon nucleic-acid-binding protein